jgi:hypothetical protein
MIHVVRLTAPDRQLLRARFVQHGNSHQRMIAALAEAGSKETCRRLEALRRIERRFDLDLAEICDRHARRQHATTHPIERMVLDFIAEEHHDESGAQLWVMPDRVQQVRELMDDRLVGEPDA